MFKKLTKDARLPERATKYSAGFDVFANEDVVVGAGETKLIGLGIALVDKTGMWLSLGDNQTPIYEMYTKYYLALHIRSSLRAKGLTSLGTGIIDMDYRDEIKMVIHNPISKHEIATTISKIDMAIENRNNKDNLDIIYKLSPLSKYDIKKGDKIGQLILCRHEGWLLPSEYTKDKERNGGFGSTGA